MQIRCQCGQKLAERNPDGAYVIVVQRRMYVVPAISAARCERCGRCWTPSSADVPPPPVPLRSRRKTEPVPEALFAGHARIA